MNAICRALTGSGLSDANRFREQAEKVSDSFKQAGGIPEAVAFLEALGRQAA